MRQTGYVLRCRAPRRNRPGWYCEAYMGTLSRPILSIRTITNEDQSTPDSDVLRCPRCNTLNEVILSERRAA